MISYIYLYLKEYRTENDDTSNLSLSETNQPKSIIDNVQIKTTVNTCKYVQNTSSMLLTTSSTLIYTALLTYLHTSVIGKHFRHAPIQLMITQQRAIQFQPDLQALHALIPIEYKNDAKNKNRLYNYT